MTNTDAIKWLENLKKDIGNPTYQSLWHYEQAIAEIIDLLADRKTENSSEKPNKSDIPTSSTGYNLSPFDKDKPQTSRENTRDSRDNHEIAKDEPQIGEMMTEEEFDSMLARVLIGKDESQTERSE